MIELHLKNEDYSVFKFHSGQDALGFMDSENVDLAILDVMLPEVSGFAICQRIREKHNFPAIILTAKGEDIDRISGLVLGKNAHECTLNEKPLSLTPTEFSILWVFTSNRGRVMSEAE